ncbi:MAG: Coenzyme F420 hydrogenase/dehydrogenase, beta subunit C-terminal domain [Clostridia bacterium]|nr:Coenzyme F420 hydrogenase/dehydrogenase, beta subunit C-terminal domain [Clostridia bacterium]
MDSAFHVIKTYGMYALDTARLQTSSSGGIFTILAEDVISRGGTVFGAAFCDDFQAVRHIAVSTVEALEKLRGSKYVRSDVKEALPKVLECLEQGSGVLFSGTPCQIAALKKYLKKNYENLLTVAVVCHGTPKHTVWADYLKELEQNYKSKVIAVNFRDKSEGWSKYRLRILFANGKQYVKTKDRDIYMCGFLQNITLEKSCFSCHFKGNNIESDIILGDFWGVERVAPKLCNYDGTSLVIVRSEKGFQAVEAKLSGVKYAEVDLPSAVDNNSSLFCSAKMPENYDAFWQAYHGNKCRKSIQKFLMKKNYFLLIKNKVLKVINRGNH